MESNAHFLRQAVRTHDALRVVAAGKTFVHPDGGVGVRLGRQIVGVHPNGDTFYQWGSDFYDSISFWDGEKEQVQSAVYKLHGRETLPELRVRMAAELSRDTMNMLANASRVEYSPEGLRGDDHGQTFGPTIDVVLSDDTVVRYTQHPATKSWHPPIGKYSPKGCPFRLDKAQATAVLDCVMARTDVLEAVS